MTRIITDRSLIHKDLDTALDLIEDARSKESHDAREHAVREAIGLLDSIVGDIITQQFEAAGKATYKFDLLNLNESLEGRHKSWPETDEERKVYNARVLIQLNTYFGQLLEDVNVPVEGINRDLLSATNVGKALSFKSLPEPKRSKGYSDHDDRRRAARRKFAVMIYLKAYREERRIEDVVKKLWEEEKTILSWDTWRKLRKELPENTRTNLKNFREDDFDYSPYDLPNSFKDLQEIAILKQ